MSWVKIDDGAREHRKQLRAGADACWMWTCGLMYAGRQKAHDGFIPEEMLPQLYPFRLPHKLAAKLVETGLWDKVDGGYRIHDFNEYQRTADEIAELAAKRAASGKQGGIKSGETRQSKQEAPSKQSNEATAKQLASTETKQPASNASAHVEPDPIQIPYREEKTSGASMSSSETRRVFDHWRTVMKKPRAVLDARRARLIEARIKSHGIDDCLRAIDGCRADPFSMGANDRKTKYNGIHVIFRDAERIEKFIGFAPPPAAKQEPLVPMVGAARAKMQAVLTQFSSVGRP